MQISRMMSAGIIRVFSLFSVIIIVSSLSPILSHATVFWDDELQAGTPFGVSYSIASGAMAYDTNVKFSGSGSVRLNFTPDCETGGPISPCGGEASRAIPFTDDLYRRVYFRMSGQGPIATSTGLFQTAIKPFTKMLRTTSDGITKLWWMMGCCGSKKFMITLENVPQPGAATNYYSSATLADNRWYCIETREKLNTPGVANGIVQAWIDGVQVLNVTNVPYRLAGNNNLWNRVAIFRQMGVGNFWWDRFAAGNTRIGCSGSITQDDTTAPTIPSGVSAQ